MTLVLQPTIEDMTTEELEQRLEVIRARRMAAAMEYVVGQNIKFEAELDKVQRKLKSHYEMLAKELDRCDRAIWACEQRVAAIELLRQELGLMQESDV